MGDWLNAQNIIAVLTALLGLVVSIGAIWYERRVPHRRRIGYRVQMDTPIGDDNRNQGQVGVRLGRFNDMSDATLVLLRIENDGAESIAGTDYTGLDVHGLTAVFTDRVVEGVAVTQSDAEHLMDHFAPAGGMRFDRNTIYLPRVPLNHGQHYKLLVLLTGGGVGSGIRVTGGIRDGAVELNRSITVDDKPPLFSRPARLITILLSLFLVTLAGIIVMPRDLPPPIGCAPGELALTGSTAFAPVVREAAKRYESNCPGTKITMDAHGSEKGVRELAELGSESKNGHPALVAFSDGHKPDGYPQLQEERVAVSAYALVVNDQLPIKTLTIDEIRKIYHGDFLNWKELNGPDLPILLISRDASSGTRDLFRRHILDGISEPAFTSLDCKNKNSPQDKVIRCELDSTGAVLKTVAALPGAIGYSELQAATTFPGLHTLRIDSQAPSAKPVGNSSYPFVEIEYAYTYGPSPAGSLISNFLNYLMRGGGQDVMGAFGQLPCYSPEGFSKCQE
ncbi:substrate-binding domain-containing protein [Frankia sp. Cj3]|uniref:substrate-binding domain-containing protein n=1 Tax=Frankia sp. Cj3 TaxID=2880976 RepID=UPI001EF6FA7A